MTDKHYPLITSRGFRACLYHPAAPPGITVDELRRVLTEVEWNELDLWADGKLAKWVKFPNGMPLDDLERFLSRSKGLCGSGRYPDGKLYCPHAKSDMTPCVARDGQLAVANDGTCVGCGQHPADLLKKVNTR